MKRIRRLYITDYCLTPAKRIEKSAILCENEKILAVGGASAFTRESELEIYEFENAYATPGFIDTHIHGAGGFDSSSAYLKETPIDNMSAILAQRGVTTFIPTVVTSQADIMLTNLSALADMIDHSLSGADPAGIHIEGPFLNRSKCGAQVAADIRDFDSGFTMELIAAAKGHIKKMTFAPELDGAEKLVELLCEHNIRPSMGHSTADEQATLRAIDAGARNCTHLFNGMPPLHQRNVTLTAVALTDERVTVELIIDGRHLHPRMIDLACRCKPRNRVVGISDSTMAAGMPDGQYHIGPSFIKVIDGYSQTADGVLAGTTALLDVGWHSLMTYSHMPETYAASCVTLNAAETLGLNDRGILLPKKRADIAFFERGTNRPLMTVRRGEIVYNSGTNLK
ncbi:MAG: N-acetylglucosamine-6-phosphate deacetylase [Victivallaceae bacterium]